MAVIQDLFPAGAHHDLYIPVVQAAAKAHVHPHILEYRRYIAAPAVGNADDLHLDLHRVTADGSALAGKTIWKKLYAR